MAATVYGRLTLSRDPDDPAQDGVLLWVPGGAGPLAEVIFRPPWSGDPRDVAVLALAGPGAAGAGLVAAYPVGPRVARSWVAGPGGGGVAFPLTLRAGPGFACFTLADADGSGDAATWEVYPVPAGMARGTCEREVRVVVRAPRAWAVLRREVAERDGRVGRRTGRWPGWLPLVTGRDAERGA